MKEMLYEVRCLKSNEDVILALAGQFKQIVQQVRGSHLHLISNTALHITFLSCTNYSVINNWQLLGLIVDQNRKAAVVLRHTFTYKKNSSND